MSSMSVHDIVSKYWAPDWASEINTTAKVIFLQEDLNYKQLVIEII
jgi:hypothetical protein